MLRYIIYDYKNEVFWRKLASQMSLWLVPVLGSTFLSFEFFRDFEMTPFDLLLILIDCINWFYVRQNLNPKRIRLMSAGILETAQKMDAYAFSWLVRDFNTCIVFMILSIIRLSFPLSIHPLWSDINFSQYFSILLETQTD